MELKRRLQRSVWVLDISDFLLYLEDCLYRLAPHFPWLRSAEPIDKHWPWTQVDRFLKPQTQYELAIDWIIRKLLAELYYIELRHEEFSPEFEAVFRELINNYDLYQHTRMYWYIPLILGDIFTHDILRQSSWLYIEADIDPAHQLP